MTKKEKLTIQTALSILDKNLKTTCFDIASMDDAINFFRLKLALSEREIFGVLFLNTRHQVIAFEELFFGTINETEVHPREVAKRALELNAACVILTHNHPSGNASQSSADERITVRLKNALSLFDIRVLDHIIIAGNSYLSFNQQGIL